MCVLEGAADFGVFLRGLPPPGLQEERAHCMDLMFALYSTAQEAQGLDFNFRSSWETVVRSCYTPRVYVFCGIHSPFCIATSTWLATFRGWGMWPQSESPTMQWLHYRTALKAQHIILISNSHLKGRCHRDFYVFWGKMCLR